MPKNQKVADIQVQLNEIYNWHPHYPLVVDGILGPKTCSALYSLQKDFDEDSGSTITQKTIVDALELTESHWAQVSTGCKPWYKGAGQGAPKVIDASGGGGEIDITAPGIVEEKSHWPMALIGAGLGAGTGYMAVRQNVIKKGTPGAAAGVGAVAGGLTFYVISKVTR